MSDVSIQAEIVKPARASIQCRAWELERLYFLVQCKQEVIVTQGSNLFWQPMVSLNRDQFSALSIYKWFPGCGTFRPNALRITEQQVLFKCGFNYFFAEFFDRYARILFFKQYLIFANKPIELFRVWHLLVFSHVAFLHLVDRVTTNTVAGGGVAFYFVCTA